MTQTRNDPTAREIVATVLIDAPRKTVWETYTKPELMRQWWVCGEMTMPVCDNDARVGGAYRFVARDAQGEYPFKGVYREVSPPGRMVCTQIFDVEPFSDAEAVVTVTATEKDGRTEHVTRIVFPTDESFAGASATGMEHGMGEALNRLAAVAEGLAR